MLWDVEHKDAGGMMRAMSTEDDNSTVIGVLVGVIMLALFLTLLHMLT